MNNRFAIILVALILGFGGILWFNKKKTENSSGKSNNAQLSQHTLGAGNKKVTLIEYGDFQCPACAQYFPLIIQIEEKYGDDITFQFRNFPLIQIHNNAMAAHRAAEAAANQNKFFEMHDALYGQQKSWADASNPTPIFESFAGQLGLNLEQYKTDVASAKTNDIINADIAEGKKIGANSTPTFVLDGKKIDNPNDLADFSKLIDEAIAAKKPTP